MRQLEGSLLQARALLRQQQALLRQQQEPPPPPPTQDGWPPRRRGQHRSEDADYQARAAARRLSLDNVIRATINATTVRTRCGGCDEGHCSICLEDFKEKDDLRWLPCGHGFHSKCVDRWLFEGVGALACPLCRADLTTVVVV
jgi:hypothetical protein